MLEAIEHEEEEKSGSSLFKTFYYRTKANPLPLSGISFQ